MDKLQARDLIREVFEQPFDKERFMVFIRNLLNRIDETKAFHARGDVKESFRSVIKTYERIGSYEASDGKKIDIIIAHLQKSYSIHHARVTQRNFAGKYLSDRNQKDAGLFAFVSPDEEDWRFSLVKMEYKFEQTKNGKTKVKEEYTPARWSFLVGANERSHTAQSRLVDILAEDEKPPTLEQIEEVFNIETVTKEFFREYRDLFIRTKEALDKVIQHDPNIQTDFNNKGVNTVDFSKKLLGQIIFLYFLQKKGWFGPGRDADWGTGSKQFLRELFGKKHGVYTNFFNDILEPLFYEALRNDRSHDDDYYSRFNCKIPFLNGGLFDPISNYDWVHTDICLPDNLFSNENKTKEGDAGDGILDIFDRYNFTVKEDEPLEKEVAIDPELLGKAYEKFNAIRPDNFEEYKQTLKSGKKGDESKFNKQFGVYYTPREIVHYMCQQSLINYLFNVINSGRVFLEKIGDDNLVLFDNRNKKGQTDLIIEHRKNPIVSKEDIEKLINAGENTIENDKIALIKEKNISEGKQKTSEYKLNLSNSIRDNIELLDQKLSEITVCDPAVGSGAFLVGMMNEIVRARTVLTELVDDKTNRTSYNFKRRCIEHSLYGVDIDSGAVEIAKLRLWLSLIVDEDDIKTIKPLPNLDYKVICGNSLIGFPETAEWKFPIEKEIEALINKHFSETNPTKKNELKTLIDEKIGMRYKKSKEIFGYEVNFDFKTIFSEVFEENSGFDVMIANPPYGASLTEVQKKYLKNRHKNIVERIRNTFIYFLGEAYSQIKQNGIVCFILPNELLFQIYMTKARRFFLENSQVLFAINLGKDVFEAIVPTCVICFMKIKRSDYSISVADLRKAKLEKLPELLTTENFPVMTNREILSAPNSVFSFNRGIADLISRLSSNFQPFETFCDDIANGICTSCDDIYIVSEKFAKENLFEKEYLKQCIRGGQFNRFYCPINTNEYVLYITENFDLKKGKNIYQYLSKNKELLIKKSIEKKQGKREWHILFRGRYEDLFKKPKIIFRQTADRIIAAIDRKSEYYCINSVNVGQVKKEYHEYLDFFVGLLNSELMVFYYQEISQEKDRVLAEIKPLRVRSLPISIGTTQERAQIAELVDRINIAKYAHPAADTKELENQIDHLVFKLYNLTDDEIKIVRETNDF